jgi:PIN domain nuclease of toxin-antitoxin system
MQGNQSHILDASALLALIKNEKGAEIVEKHIENSIISTVNYAEIVAYFIRANISEEDINLMLNGIVNEIVNFNEEQSITSGLLIAKTNKYGLSFGDRACLALAIQMNLPVLTADKSWSKIKSNIEIKIIR